VNAAAGMIVLLFTMLILNGGAIYLRNRLQRKSAA
jgi:ABC-type phosphate transport system permease subunit